MKAVKNAVPTKQQPIRRKLRSASRFGSKDCPMTGASSDQKAIQQIQKQLDSLESINHSKSTGLVQEDGKLGVGEVISYCMRTRRTRYVDLPRPKVDCLAREMATKELLEEVQVNVGALVVEEVLPEPELLKYEPEQFVTPVKQEVRNLKLDETPGVKLSRRSGRKHKRNTVTQVPFRKFQDSFEQKIVMLINRIYQRKSNEKDFELLIEKLQRISPKELYNPYVISGVQTVLNLIERPSLEQVVILQRQVRLVARFEQEVKRLSGRIWEELGKIDDYEDVQVERREVDFEEIRPKFIKKVYRMLLESERFGLREAREKSFEVSECFFANYDNYARGEDLLSFFKEQKFLTC